MKVSELQGDSSIRILPQIETILTEVASKEAEIGQTCY